MCMCMCTCMCTCTSTCSPLPCREGSSRSPRRAGAPPTCRPRSLRAPEVRRQGLDTVAAAPRRLANSPSRLKSGWELSQAAEASTARTRALQAFLTRRVPCDASYSLIIAPSSSRLPMRLEVMKPGLRCTCEGQQHGEVA